MPFKPDLPLAVPDELIHCEEVQAALPVPLQEAAEGVGTGGVNDHGEAVLSRVVEQLVLVANVVLS